MPKLIPLCPICKKRDVEKKLRLKQINLDTAVYLCDDADCSYPEGCEWLLEKRSLAEMLHDNRKRKKHKKKRKTQSEANSNNNDLSQLNVDHLLENEIDKLQDSFNLDCQDLDSFLFNEMHSSPKINILQMVTIDKAGAIKTENINCEMQNKAATSVKDVNVGDGDASNVFDYFDLDLI